MDTLLEKIDALHTTPMGAERVGRNLGVETGDAVAWCRKKITAPGTVIVRKGKNWYAETDECRITVNAGSCTIITAHRKGKRA
jgi:hypothetical protein